MRPHKAVLAAAVALGFATALTSGASADTAPKAKVDVRAAGGDVPPTLPSAVRVRIRRGRKALDKAGEYVDKDRPNDAVNSLRGARRNMYAAWRAARYGIVNAPAPPADDEEAPEPPDPDDAVGTIYASPEETAVAVLGFQHEVVAATMGLLDGAKGTLRDQLSTTLFAALDRRDGAISFIRTLPVPPEGEEGSDDAVGFDVLMPAIIVDLDDEQAQAAELLEGGALTPGEKRIVSLAVVQSVATENTVNTAWPPAVED